MAGNETNKTEAPAADASASSTATASGDANVAVAGAGATGGGGGEQQAPPRPLVPSDDLPPSRPGCVFVITGATRGMGRSLAVELARRGHLVAACGTNREAVEAMQAELGEKHLVMVTDVVRDGHCHVAANRLLLLCHAVLCRAVPCLALLCRAVLCGAMHAMLHCDVLFPFMSTGAQSRFPFTTCSI